MCSSDLRLSSGRGTRTRLGDVDAVEVVGAEGRVALGALPLPGVVARLDALEAEDVEALGQDGVLHPRVATRAGQTSLVQRGGVCVCECGRMQTLGKGL